MFNTTDSHQRSAGSVRSVCLVGFMGSGKSCVGQALALRLGWPFLDLDQRIEQHAGRTVAQIFSEDGEPAFRRMEHDELRNILSNSSYPQIVAVGGGAFVQTENAALLAAHRVISVFLDAPAEVLWQRCKNDPQERPLRQTFEQFETLYRGRRPHYLKATRRIDSASQSVEQIASALASEVQAAKYSGQQRGQENVR
jgi:shikimate kinase